MAIMQVGPAGIETISGAMKKPKKKEGHNHGSYLIATHRVAATTNPNCQRLYVKGPDAYKRSTPVTNDERAARLRFATVSRAVNARMKDLSKITADQAAFMAQRDTAAGKKTMKAYLWSLEGVAYDDALQG